MIDKNTLDSKETEKKQKEYLTKRYIKFIGLLHPDNYKGEYSIEKTRLINIAYSMLIAVAARRVYNLELISELPAYRDLDRYSRYMAPTPYWTMFDQDNFTEVTSHPSIPPGDVLQLREALQRLAFAKIMMDPENDNLSEDIIRETFSIKNGDGVVTVHKKKATIEALQDELLRNYVISKSKNVTGDSSLECSEGICGCIGSLLTFLTDTALVSCSVTGLVGWPLLLKSLRFLGETTTPTLCMFKDFLLYRPEIVYGSLCLGLSAAAMKAIMSSKYMSDCDPACTNYFLGIEKLFLENRIDKLTQLQQSQQSPDMYRGALKYKRKTKKKSRKIKPKKTKKKKPKKIKKRSK